MTRSTSRDRLRLTVSGVAEPFDLSPEDVGTVADQQDVDADRDRQDRPEPSYRPERQPRRLASTADDRAAGLARYDVTVDGWVFEVTVEAQARAELRERAGQGVVREGASGEHVVRAQIPGRVVRLWVAEGDTVEAGQRLLAIEAMKMENELRSPQAGTVASLRVAIGSSVELGDELITVR